MSDNESIRAPGKKIPLTQHQVEELIKCADPVTGYEYFMRNYFYIQHPIRGQLLYDPYPYQIELIHNYATCRYSISMLSRQLGKTTSAAGYLLWFAMFNSDKVILIAAHQYTGAQEIMSRIRYAYELCPMWLKPGAEAYNQGNIDFENKSRIVARATTEKTGRGMAISLLYIDEFAFLRPSIAREFWTAISPTLATGGRCIITSTPNSDEDQFAQIWKDANILLDEFGNTTELGKNGFKPYKAIWSDHPDRDQAWADEERSKIGEDRFRREHECAFLTVDETLIKANTLAMLEGIEPTSTMGQVRWYKKPEKGMLYAVALDPALGTGGDNAAIQIFEASTMTQIGEWKHNKTAIPSQIKLMAEIISYISEITNEPNSIYYSIENNSIGEAALISLNEYGEANISGIFISEPGKKRRGFTTTNKTKLTACAKFKTLVESKKMTIKSRALITELKAFVATGPGYAAKIGMTDDLVMSSLLAVRMMVQMSDFNGDLDSQMRDHSDFIQPLPFFAVFS